MFIVQCKTIGLLMKLPKRSNYKIT